jgi:hypothetical protein
MRRCSLSWNEGWIQAMLTWTLPNGSLAVTTKCMQPKDLTNRLVIIHSSSASIPEALISKTANNLRSISCFHRSPSSFATKTKIRYYNLINSFAELK